MSNSKTINAKSYRPDIQGLRALAVLAVIANHFSKSILPNGFLGVDVFFVISGFVITSLLHQTDQASFKSFIIEFYERRIKRLFPALILCVVVTTFGTILFVAPWQNLFYGPAWHTGLAALAGLANMYLLSLSVDYFSGSAELNPFTQTWSLGVEEQFYVLYPIIFWSVHRYWSRRSFLIVMVALSVASMFVFLNLSKTNPPAAFYLMPTRFWELGLGCIAFYVGTNTLPNYFKNSCLLALLFVIMFLGQWPIAATIAACLLTVGLLVCPAQNSHTHKLLSTQTAIYIGAISYPLYLWHWSVLSLSRWTIGIDIWTAPVQLTLIFALAAATHKWVELPLKNAGWSTTKLRTVLYGLSALLGAMGIIAVLGSSLKGQLYAGTRSSPKVANAQPQDYSMAIETAKAAYQKCNLTPDDLTGAEYRPRPKADNAFYQTCLAGQKPKIILTGDSFSNVVAPNIALIAKRLGYDYKTVMGYGCPLPFKLHGPFAAETHCNIDVGLMLNQIEANVNAGDIVVLRLSLAKPQYIKINRRSIEQGDPNLLNIYDEVLNNMRAAVQAKGARFLLIGSNLTLEFSPACLNHQWFNTRLTRDCSSGVSYNSTLENQLAIAFDKHHESHLGEQNFFSVMKHLCNDQTKTCKTSEQQEYLYTDDSHLSLKTIDLVNDDLAKALDNLFKQ